MVVRRVGKSERGMEELSEPGKGRGGEEKVTKVKQHHVVPFHVVPCCYMRSALVISCVCGQMSKYSDSSAF